MPKRVWNEDIVAALRVKLKEKRDKNSPQYQAWHLKLNEAPRAEEEATIFLRVLFAKARDAQTDGAETDDYDDDARDDEIVDLCDSPPDLAAESPREPRQGAWSPKPSLTRVTII